MIVKSSFKSVKYRFLNQVISSFNLHLNRRTKLAHGVQAATTLGLPPPHNAARP